MKRIRAHDTPIARRLRRLGLGVEDFARWARVPLGTLKHWKQGTRRTPAYALRLVAAWRLVHWRKR